MKLITKTIITLAISAISATSITADDNSNLAWKYVREFSTHLATPDRIDYSEEFYYQNYLTSLQARDEMPWGKCVPEREFEHFVLPVRVNNENLDTARMVFYRELKDRVQNLSMEDAILEVNHWCHEKVSYRPSDARTSSPLATMRTAYGRCGEESTFLVTALRSVCIPARQVYTPRWAHTDDNHAWVEAWANGKWLFLGACEPEPVLNLGWFNESASRGMLMHTKVAGTYHGPEEVMSLTPCYTEINVTGNYAPTSRVDINVVDAFGNPVPDATVEFKLYNYAEFYTVAKKITDENGATYLTAGKGDLLVWVTKDEFVAVKEVSWTNDHYETIELNDKLLPKIIQLDIVPPPSSVVLPEVTDEQRALNDRRKAQEDSIRQAYEATMPVEAWRGNYRTIQQFIDEASNKIMANKLLEVLSAKDLRDINLEVLRDNEVTETDTTDIYCRYVLCPRVENEWLTPYKSYFYKELGNLKNIGELITWTKEHITINNDYNPQRLRQQPMSVYRTRSTDELGRAIFFVSAARSMGWPARINEVTGKLEFFITPFHGGSWQEVNFNDDIIPINLTPKGTLMLNLAKNGREDLSYYTHFTLSKIVDGKAQLLTYPEDATWSNTFKNGVSLEEGTYMLTTGNRQRDGSVLASTTTFEIKNHEFTNITLALREKNKDATAVLGTMASNLSYYSHESGTDMNLPQGESYIVGIVLPSHEPTNHALRDISTCATQLEQWGGKIFLLNLSTEQEQRFNKGEFVALPSTVVWGIDRNMKILKHINEQLNQQSQALPLFVIVDENGNITFIKQGYTIHLGEQLLEVIKSIFSGIK